MKSFQSREFHQQPNQLNCIIANAKIIIISMLVLTIGISLATVMRAVDCIYNPADPQTNCRDYCGRHFSAPPQRRYYNRTSKNCERMNSCPHRWYYYSYDKNKCFDSKQQKKVIDYVEPDTPNTIYIQDFMDPVVCVHGNLITETLFKAPEGCACNLFWTDSNYVNSQGMPYKCDIVQTNFTKVFSSIKTVKGVQMYDNYTQEQANQIFKNALNQMAIDKLNIALQNQPSIDYLISLLAMEPLVSTNLQIVCALFMILLVSTIISITIYQLKNHKVTTTKAILKFRIMELISTQQ